MSIHAGVFFFDGRPSCSAARPLAAAVAHLAGCPVDVDAEDGIAIVRAMESAWLPRSPSRGRGRGVARFAIGWDGRLDNREDLLLRLNDRCADDIDDASLAARVVERWGLDGLRLLIGEWSAALWDAQQRTLHLARDAMGVRPLYYFADRQNVLWSTELGELALRSGRREALSDEFAARFLTVRLRGEVTPYEDLRGVPAATCVSFTTDRLESRRRYWMPASGVVRYRHRVEYEEHLRALWRESIAARLRTDAAVWAELSGGLDSSSVVCMASWLVANDRVPAPALRPLSYVTMRSQEGDERRFIAEVEREIGAASEIVAIEDHEGLLDAASDWITPFAARDVNLAAARLISNRGGRVVLSGRAGDAVMGCAPDNSVAVLDDIAAGHPLTALANLHRWSLATKKPFVEIAWQLARACSPRRACEGPPPDVALLSTRLRQIPIDDGPEMRVPLAEIRRATRGLASLLIEYAFRSALTMPQPPYGLVYSYPFTHRPLVEFMLSIPGEEWSAPGDMRSLMRRAFAGFVPARILARTSKGHYSPAVARAVRPLAQSLPALESLEVVRRGWIDPSRLRAAVRALVDGGGATRTDVRRVLRLEGWLASRDRRGPAAIPQRKEVTDHEVLNA